MLDNIDASALMSCPDPTLQKKLGDGSTQYFFSDGSSLIVPIGFIAICDEATGKYQKVRVDLGDNPTSPTDLPKQ
jgi:hypothetical protein